STCQRSFSGLPERLTMPGSVELVMIPLIGINSTLDGSAESPDTRSSSTLLGLGPKKSKSPWAGALEHREKASARDRQPSRAEVMLVLLWENGGIRGGV